RRSSPRPIASRAQRGARCSSGAPSWLARPASISARGKLARKRRAKPMRIATWNVNSLKARLEKVVWWLERAKPDVLLMQETKLSDADAPVATFEQAGYELAHHGEGRWNGVAIASRVGIADVVSNFGQPLRPAATPDLPDDEPLAEAPMVSVAWWDERGWTFPQNCGTGSDHLLVTKSGAARTVWVEIEREARKGKPLPSDHAPLVVDLDEPGHAFDAGWKAAEGRIAARGV